MRDIDFNAAVAMLVDTAENADYGFKYTKPSEGEAPSDMGGGCFYVHKDESGELTVPGCIVGTAFLREKLMAVEDFQNGGFLCHYNGNDSHRLISEITRHDNPTARFTERAQFFIREVQSQQDRGIEWSKAVQSALYAFNKSTFRNRYDDTFPQERETVSE